MKRLGQTAVIAFTFAAIIGLGSAVLPRTGQVPKGVQPVGPGHEAQLQSDPAEQLTFHALTQKLEKTVIAPAAAFSPSTLPSEAPTQQAPAQEAQPQKLDAAVPPPGPSNAAGMHFEIGDKLKILVYERIEDVEQNKWSRGGGALQGFGERPEFGGEYSIGADGTITLPLLGQFSAADRSARDVQDAIAASFQNLTERRSLVTIVSVERPPIYVLGPVKAPGTYKYMPGMTVLHAIALAGGSGTQNADPWQQLEAVKAQDKRRASMQLLPTLLARRAVLKAEHDDATPAPSPDLLQLAGPDIATMLIAQEVERRKGIVSARQSQKDALLRSLAVAQQQMQRLSDAQRPLDQLVKLRKERADSMQRLAKKGTISREVLIQAQGDLADAVQRRQDASNQLNYGAQQQLAAVQQELARQEVDKTFSLENQIAALDQQITAMDSDATTSLNVLNVLQPASYAPGSGATEVEYKIVRQTAKGPVEIAANGLTLLQPGDLVEIGAPEAAAKTDGIAKADGSQAGDSLAQPSSTILIHDTTP